MVLRGVHMLDGVWAVGTGASTNKPVGREASGVTAATIHRVRVFRSSSQTSQRRL